jgi:hypothetical protein
LALTGGSVLLSRTSLAIDLRLVITNTAVTPLTAAAALVTELATNQTSTVLSLEQTSTGVSITNQAVTKLLIGSEI